MFKTKLTFTAGLPALALRRTGDLLWVGASARDLQAMPQPEAEADLIRWAQVALGAGGGESARWPPFQVTPTAGARGRGGRVGGAGVAGGGGGGWGGVLTAAVGGSFGPRPAPLGGQRKKGEKNSFLEAHGNGGTKNI